MKYAVSYISGGTKVHSPGSKILDINDEGITLKLALSSQVDFIPWDDVLDVEILQQIENKQISAKKAVIGGVLFGPVGAVLGGMSGTKKLKIAVSIAYLGPRQIQRDLVLGVDHYTAERIQSEIEEALAAED